MFVNREDAGRRLATLLEQNHIDSPVVVAIPRGGVVVGNEVARAVDAPLDFVMTVKINTPIQPDVAIGVVAPGGVLIIESFVANMMRIERERVQAMTEAARQEADRKTRRFRRVRHQVPLRGRNVILIDEGIASGLTMRAAAEAVRMQDPRNIIAAVPVASPHGMRYVAGHVDDIIFLRRPAGFFGVGQWYRDFAPVRDADVERVLASRPQVERPVRGGGAPRITSLEPSHFCY